jgi:hypothetical protein
MLGNFLPTISDCNLKDKQTVTGSICIKLTTNCTTEVFRGRPIFGSLIS